MNQSIRLLFLALILLLSASSQAVRCDESLAKSTWEINVLELNVAVLSYDDFYRKYSADTKVLSPEELASLERIDDKKAHEKGLQGVTNTLKLSTQKRLDILPEPTTINAELFEQLKRSIPDGKPFVLTNRRSLQTEAARVIKSMKEVATTSELDAKASDFFNNYINPWLAFSSAWKSRLAERIANDQARLNEIEKTKQAFVSEYVYSTRTLIFDKGILYFISDMNGGKWWKVDKPLDWLTYSGRDQAVQISILN